MPLYKVWKETTVNVNIVFLKSRLLFQELDGSLIFRQRNISDEVQSSRQMMQSALELFLVFQL